jgi:hypothetical protein
MNTIVSLVLALGGMVFIFAAGAQTTDQARTLHVANNGVDNTDCGGPRPCRSISRAITNARDGDRILVGPGTYGDANGDGDFNDLGDEFGDVQLCGGIVCVDKRLTILSVFGASTTVIDAADIEFQGTEYAVVAIIASEAIFGRTGKGFTLANAPTGLTARGGNVRVTGNTASGNKTGFSINVPQFGGDVWIRNNVATNNTNVGFHALSFGPGTIFLSNNSSIDNEFRAGFFVVGPGRYVIRNNMASGNSHGFLLDAENNGNMVVQFNIATHNETGFDLQGVGYLFRSNSAIGNRGAGIRFPPDAGEIAVHGNNFFGNLGFGDSVVPGCGLNNESGNRIDARNNFWGAASGPGADPADNAGGICDRTSSSVTVVQPFAEEAFPLIP